MDIVVPVNYLAVLVCGIASMVLGFVWYGPLFGKKWMQLSGISMQGGSKSAMHRSYAVAFVASLVTAYVLAHIVVFSATYFGISGLSAGLQAGFWSWLGFVGPVTLGMVLWERKPWTLWILLNGYQLLLMLVMGAILALWQ